MENERLADQLATTCNFSGISNVFSRCLGDLTNQIEHHLFPHISHVHYKNIAPLEAQTSSKFGLPYHENGNFLMAIAEHFKMPYQLGQIELQPIHK